MNKCNLSSLCVQFFNPSESVIVRLNTNKYGFEQNNNCFDKNIFENYYIYIFSIMTSGLYNSLEFSEMLGS